MHINRFHVPGAQPSEEPMRFYGLVVEDEQIEDEKRHPARYVVIDLIGADWFKSHEFGDWRRTGVCLVA